MNEDPTAQFDAYSVNPQAPPPLNDTWGGFRLFSRVGAGAFGEVFRAWDPDLQREIALKLLLPGTLDSEDAYQTTLREARALASVRHPNIVSIYGCNRHDGRVGFWTDFIHGKTLASLLNTQGPFGYHEAALIGLEVTRALAAVHRVNLLHRDIKPENVMREEGGRILLMDFGLSALPQHNIQLAGTPNYMAPELFRREPASIKSDLYAVGILLYFLVSGQTPAQLSGLTTAQAAEACMQRKPLIDLRFNLPEIFLRLVNRAIAPNPADRFQSAGEMAEALAASIGASASSPASSSIPLPLTPISPEAITTRQDENRKEKQERNPWIRLAISAAVLFFIFGRKLPLVGRLFMNHESTASSSGTRQTQPEASDQDDQPDSSDLYDQAQALLLKSYKASDLNAAIDKFKQIPPADAQYPLALAGLGNAHFIQYRNTQDHQLLDQSIAETNRAITLNPKAAPPYVTLARIAASQGKNMEAMQFAQSAINHDHSNADAYRVRADILSAVGRHDEALSNMQTAADLAPDDWRFPMSLGLYHLASGKLQAAADAFRRSADLAQDNGEAFYNLGCVELQLNQLDQSRQDLNRALVLDPHAGIYEAISSLNIAKRDYSAAINAGEKARDMEPDDYLAWQSLADAYRMLPADRGRAQQAYLTAIRYAEEARRKQPANIELLASLAIDYARAGEATRASSVIRQAALLAPTNIKVQYLTGQAAEIIGDRPEAIALIAKSISGGYPLDEINTNPELASLRADPRFQETMHKTAPSKT